MDKNIPILEQLIEKRHEMAKLLNYHSYSELVLENLMAKKVSTVQTFEEKLARKLMKKAKSENDRLLEFKKSETKDPNAVLQPWDTSYYARIEREKKF